MSEKSVSDNKPLMAINNEIERRQKNESKILKLFSFLSLTDYEVLKECGNYDRSLVYAMVGRQLVTFAFTCMLFTYGVSQFLDFTTSVFMGVIFSLTLFFLDQAIIGSDWAMKNPFTGSLPFRSLLGLLPRIVYSLIIAIGLATLAEISLQADAIDEQIQKESNQKNGEYFSKLEKYEQELDASIRVDRQKLDDIQSSIQTLSEQNTRYEVASSTGDRVALQNTLEFKQLDSTELQRTQQVLLSELASINTRLATAREDYNFWFNEALLERTGKDGRAPTEGPKYHRAVETYTDLKEQIQVLEANRADTQKQLDDLKPTIDSALQDLNEVEKNITELQFTEVNFVQNKQTIIELNEELVTAKAALDLAIDEKQGKMDLYRKKLERDGLFYPIKTGVLRRYLALKSIHNDPEIGEAALMFSWLLKTFFIAIELMPVIIKLFFSPFSFYSLRMYRKMHVAVLEEQEKLEVAKATYKGPSEYPIMNAG